MSIRIMGTGSALPGRVVENRELEGMVDTSDEWIRERTGIGSRHVSTGETVASLAAEACGRALADAGRQAEEVELILAATCSPEEAAPCVACRIQSEIGAGNAVAFDGTCILFGDGAGAVYVEKCETGGILGFVQHADGKKGGVLGGGGRQLSNPWAGQQDYRRFFQMDGREVFAFAVRQVPLNVEEALGKAGLAIGDVDLFVLHQANRRIIEGVAKRLGVSLSLFPMNLERVGNTSSAAIPLLLDELNREGRLRRGMRLVLSGFGAGLTCGACVMEW